MKKKTLNAKSKPIVEPIVLNKSTKKTETCIVQGTGEGGLELGKNYTVPIKSAEHFVQIGHAKY